MRRSWWIAAGAAALLAALREAAAREQRDGFRFERTWMSPKVPLEGMAIPGEFIGLPGPVADGDLLVIEIDGTHATARILPAGEIDDGG